MNAKHVRVSKGATRCAKAANMCAKARAQVSLCAFFDRVRNYISLACGLPAMDEGLPAMDEGLPAVDEGLPAVDLVLPAVEFFQDTLHPPIHAFLASNCSRPAAALRELVILGDELVFVAT